MKRLKIFPNSKLLLKVKNCFFLLLGLVDVITRSNVCRSQESALVFHEISDMPSKLSQLNKTNITVKQFTELVKEYENSNWMKKLRIQFTFDDGFKLSDDILDLLEAAKVRSIFFINSSTIDSKINCDAIRVMDYLSSLPNLDSGKKAFDSPDRIEEIVTTFTKPNHFYEFQGPYFTWNELRALEKRQFMIGDHFIYHVDVTRLTLQDLDRLITASRTRFREERIHCSSFALPYGKANRKVIELLKHHQIISKYGGSAYSLLSQRLDCIPRVQVTEKTQSIRVIRGELLFNRFIQQLFLNKYGKVSKSDNVSQLV